MVHSTKNERIFGFGMDFMDLISIRRHSQAMIFPRLLTPGVSQGGRRALTVQIRMSGVFTPGSSEQTPVSNFIGKNRHEFHCLKHSTTGIHQFILIILPVTFSSLEALNPPPPSKQYLAYGAIRMTFQECQFDLYNRT